MLLIIFRYLYNRLVANEYFHIFGFIEPSLILQPIGSGVGVDEQAVALTNQFGMHIEELLFVPYNIRLLHFCLSDSFSNYR